MKSNAVDPALLLTNKEKDDMEAGRLHTTTMSDSYGGIRNSVGIVLFIPRMYRVCCISLVICLVIAGMCCLIQSSDTASPSAAITSVANTAASTAMTSPYINDRDDNKQTLDKIGDTERLHHIDGHHPVSSVSYVHPHGKLNQSSDENRMLTSRIQLRPYKDTGIRLPVLPNYGSPETARLGCDHIYVIHNLGHPDRLLRMVKLLQLLRISAEFVPVMQPPESLLRAHMAALNRTSNIPSLENIIEWHTRHRIFRDMAEQGYRSAMVLDDSVDMELNIKTIMRAIHRHIPTDWDMLFPGHCGAFEGTQPRPSPDALPSLRLANMPICLHAHAISRQGLMRLLHSLPPLPTSNEIIGMAIMRLKEKGLLKMYSVDTPVFAPRPAAEHEATGLAGNKKLDISAVDHLALWQGQNKQKQH
ncbi:hypothetical protein EV178_003815 [Coemansia sp. RSA 1646]|nr:hypothetical protein EV178_003815 [Coemansia sp. RSA 1646]